MTKKERDPIKNPFITRFVVPAGTSLGIWLVLNFLSTNLDGFKARRSTVWQ